MKQKVFFITFKGHSLKQIKTTFLQNESLTLRTSIFIIAAPSNIFAPIIGIKYDDGDDGGKMFLEITSNNA